MFSYPALRIIKTITLDIDSKSVIVCDGVTIDIHPVRRYHSVLLQAVWVRFLLALGSDYENTFYYTNQGKDTTKVSKEELATAINAIAQ